MGFLSSFVGSFKKSKRLHELQMKISPQDSSINIQDLFTGSGNYDQAITEYLDLCEQDEGVAKVMNQYNLGRDDLKEIYHKLNATGAGQWIKGQYVALSTIAYSEPLLYVIESQKQGTAWASIVVNVLYYWEGRISQGGLLK